MSKIIAEIELPDEIFGQLVTKEYLEKRLAEIIAGGGGVIQPEPEPLPKCDEGPEIKSIKVSKPNQLIIGWHGKNVYGLEYTTIDSNGNETNKGLIEPKGNTVVLDLKNNLKIGTHSLKLRGTLCNGESIKEFRVTVNI